MTGQHGMASGEGGLSAPHEACGLSPRGYLGQDEKAPVVQGWCPGALRPMMSGDGLVVRVRPRLGRLRADQARGIAQLAAVYGNGLIDLSARANVQMRGVTEAGHAALIAGLRALDLVDETVAQETRRNIIVQPFAVEGDETLRIAADLAARLAQADAPELPGKFGFAVDAGPVRVLEGTACDIRIERHDDALWVRPDGTRLGVRVGADEAAAAAVDLARWFLEMGGVRDGRGRMAALMARQGVVLPFAATGLPDAPAVPAPAPGPCAGGWLVAFEFGQMQAETLATLADLGDLRVTPWRMLLVEGAGQAPALPGVITNPADPMLRVVACTGAPGCVQARAATRPLARALAPHLDRPLHVSGCAKGCAHPTAADLTLTATSGGFALIRGGTAADAPLSLHSEAALIARPSLLTE
ncbi:precorrin-3B synthase [Gemmobacter lanyuensis]|uniref:Precorrin-3B synthase n=1 Tax=Gemmobacter lanyuensis TaxID=1054497 RepID=A0A918IZ10_9RHOB|nr:precorrin-3B synthase [Gemmobacter lanyuensis]